MMKRDTSIKSDSQWWKHGIVYHIYVRSFYDSNGDGVGDIQGIIQKFDYLVDLGIHAIWLSPVYDSPNADFGYDVRDYRKIYPEYGSQEDLFELINLAHRKGIRIIMDMILNHTSIEHAWFVESSSSLNNPKRNWYIWKSPKNGRVPNNWKSAFGGTGWEFDSKSGQYYFHSFFKEQADLNWHSTDVQKAFFDELKFWLDIGIDGFRLDVINFIVKDKKMRNNPFIFNLFRINKQLYTHNRPGSYKIIKKLRAFTDSFPERVLIGEIYATPPGNPAIAASYLGKGNDLLHLTFNFAFFFKIWNARVYYKSIKRWLKLIPRTAWPCFVFSNHDLGRSINRFLTGTNTTEKAKILATLLLTIKGTPIIYYGEEIGLPNSKIDKKCIHDPLGKKLWPFYSGRDGYRTPMQWNSDKYAGFSSSIPWLPFSVNWNVVNVEFQKKDASSIFSTYKKLIEIRNYYKALQTGSWKPILKGNNGVISYYRVYNDEKVLIILNFTNHSKKITLKSGNEYKLLYSSFRNEFLGIQNLVVLGCFEAIVMFVKKKN